MPEPTSKDWQEWDSRKTAAQAAEHAGRNDENGKGAEAIATALIYVGDQIGRLADLFTRPRIRVPATGNLDDFGDAINRDWVYGPGGSTPDSTPPPCASVATTPHGTIQCMRGAGHDGSHIGHGADGPATWDDRADEPPPPTPHT